MSRVIRRAVTLFGDPLTSEVAEAIIMVLGVLLPHDLQYKLEDKSVRDKPGGSGPPALFFPGAQAGGAPGRARTVAAGEALAPKADPCY